MSGTILKKATELIKKGVAADQEKHYEEAIQLYNTAIDYFLHALKYEASDRRTKEEIRTRCTTCLKRAEQLKKLLAENRKVQSFASTATRSDSKDKGSKEADNDHDDTDKKLRRQVEGTIVQEKPNVHWDDIAGLTVAKKALEEIVVLPVKFPQLLKGKTQQFKGILLYGPPGTGKSYLAKAVATESKLTFFSVSSGDLIGKQLSVSGRLLKNLFEMARASKPAIIFIDDVDSLCSHQSSFKSDATRPIKAEFLVQMQGDNDGIIVLGATNVPWMLDAVIRGWFKKRIYIPLPEEAARRHIFQIHIDNTATDCSPQDLTLLAARTDGYSGADIGVVVREALMMPIRKIQTATHFKCVRGPAPNDPGTIVNDLLTPCAPHDPGAIEMNWMSIESNKIKAPNATTIDFFKSLENTRPTVNKDDLKRFEQFTAEFGQEG